MRVLVTRPAVSATRTAERLRALGHEPVFLPLTEAAHAPDVALGALQKPYAALAMTSAEAARALDPIAANLTEYFTKRLYAVGPATARAASDLGFRDIRTGPGTGLGLAELMAGEARDPTFPLLYLTGRPRSSRFEDRLLAEGLAVDVAEIYEMRAISHEPEQVAAALLSPPVDAVLLYSRESASHFARLAENLLPSLPKLQWLCISANVAAAVPATHHANIRTAASPDEDGLMCLL